MNTYRISNRLLLQMLLYIHDIDSSKLSFGSEQSSLYDLIIKLFITEIDKNDTYRKYIKNVSVSSYQTGNIRAVATKMLNKHGEFKVCSSNSCKVMDSEFNYLVKSALEKAYKYTDMLGAEIQYKLSLYNEVTTEHMIDKGMLLEIEAELVNLAKIAFLILDIDIISRDSDGNNFSMEQIEWFIWQEFIATYIQRNCNYRVRKQVRISAADGKINVYPDIVVYTNADTVVILDAKHYAYTSSRNNNIFQMYYYCNNFNSCYKVAYGCLIYTSDTNKVEDITSNNTRMYEYDIDINSDFNELLHNMGEFTLWMIKSAQ